MKWGRGCPGGMALQSRGGRPTAGAAPHHLGFGSDLRDGVIDGLGAGDDALFSSGHVKGYIWMAWEQRDT